MYNVFYSVVGSATYTHLLSGIGGGYGNSFGGVHSGPTHASGGGGLKLGITDSSGVLASGVDPIQFVMLNGPGTSTGTVYRELDVIGVATVPEPSAALLGGLGVLALLRRR